MKNPTNYEVGFGKPPVHSQFKKGQSGNVRGRPKGKQNFITALNNAIGEKLWIVENGKRRSITKLEAAFKQMSNKAAQGDSRALQQLISLGNLIGVESSKKTAELDVDERTVINSLVKRLSSDSLG